MEIAMGGGLRRVLPVRDPMDCLRHLPSVLHRERLEQRAARPGKDRRAQDVHGKPHGHRRSGHRRRAVAIHGIHPPQLPQGPSRHGTHLRAGRHRGLHLRQHLHLPHELHPRRRLQHGAGAGIVGRRPGLVLLHVLPHGDATAMAQPPIMGHPRRGADVGAGLVQILVLPRHGAGVARSQGRARQLRSRHGRVSLLSASL
mmetsp:Transcript_7356/g.19896  ORF Transcript_7356/g.19896 Transcript_7356/m.19896 type:complete len:200 (-) Transcript_7356:684-1283(-)